MPPDHRNGHDNPSGLLALSLTPRASETQGIGFKSPAFDEALSLCKGVCRASREYQDYQVTASATEQGDYHGWDGYLRNAGVKHKIMSSFVNQHWQHEQMTWAHLSLWEGLTDGMGMSGLSWFIHSFTRSANICWGHCVPSTQQRYTKMNQAWLLSSRNSCSRKINKYIKNISAGW